MKQREKGANAGTRKQSWGLGAGFTVNLSDILLLHQKKNCRSVFTEKSGPKICITGKPSLRFTLCSFKIVPMSWCGFRMLIAVHLKGIYVFLLMYSYKYMQVNFIYLTELWIAVTSEWHDTDKADFRMRAAVRLYQMKNLKHNDRREWQLEKLAVGWHHMSHRKRVCW